MLLYAGTTLYLNYFSILNNAIVKIFKLKSKSAGNENGSSETLCNNSKKISIHIPTHLKPFNDKQFGYYLAGLIEGNGDFNKLFQLIIVFHYLDITLAYQIRSYIGYGTVKKIKNTNSSLYILTHKKGIEKVLFLINNKIKSEYKYNQIKENILIKFPNINFSKDQNPSNFNNHWLAGFSDANASFKITIVNIDKNTITIFNDFNESKKEIKLNYQINFKNRDILDLIKINFNGIISYEHKDNQLNNNTLYSYESTSFESARKIINYFDKYHLLSKKYINYLKWRKTYILIQDKKYLTS